MASLRCQRCMLIFETALAVGAGGVTTCPRCNWPGDDTRDTAGSSVISTSDGEGSGGPVGG